MFGIKERYDYIKEGTEDYYKHWAGFDVKNKTVLDIGSDWGTTAKFFMIEGAKKVIGIEGRIDLWADARKLNLKNCEFIHKIISDPFQLSVLITEKRPNAVKVDIEGSEVLLLAVDDRVLSLVDQWTIECHSAKIAELIKNQFERLNYYVESNDFLNLKNHDMIVYIITKAKN